MPALRRLGLLVALALLATACGDDGDETLPPDPSTTTTTTTASSTTATPPPDDGGDGDEMATSVTVATINVLHGIVGLSGCGETTDQCHAGSRIDILWDLLETEAGCPEIIGLEEISPRQQELVPEKLAELCAGDHVLLVDDLGLPDQEMILTTLDVMDDARVSLAGTNVWSAHWAQLEADDGLVVDVFTTHYASSALNPECGPAGSTTDCSPTCTPETLLGDCHPIQTLEFLEANAAPGSLQLVIGDLNQPLDHVRIQTLVDAGFVDTHTAAGEPECDPDTGEGCTSGIGGDTELDGLDIVEQTPGSRIDFILARPPTGCEVVVEDDDTDGDGTRTGLWADEPLAEPVDGLVWASDHTGNQADLGVACT